MIEAVLYIVEDSLLISVLTRISCIMTLLPQHAAPDTPLSRKVIQNQSLQD